MKRKYRPSTTFKGQLRPKLKSGHNKGKKHKKRMKGDDFGWLLHLIGDYKEHQRAYTPFKHKWYK